MKHSGRKKSMIDRFLAGLMLGCALATSACVTGTARPSSADFHPGTSTQSLGDSGENAP